MRTLSRSMGESVAAENFTSHKQKDLSETGRVCSDPECGTVLSVYNKTDRCTQHRRSKLPKDRAKRRKG